MCSIFGLHAACFCGVVAKRTDSESVNMEGKHKAEIHWNKTLKIGLLMDMQKRGIID